MPLLARWKFLSLLVLHGNGHPVILLNTSQICSSSQLIEPQFLAQFSALCGHSALPGTHHLLVQIFMDFFHLNEVYFDQLLFRFSLIS